MLSEVDAFKIYHIRSDCQYQQYMFDYLIILLSCHYQMNEKKYDRIPPEINI